jgi:hypothetical protein
MGLQEAPHLCCEGLEGVVVDQAVSDPLKLSPIHEERYEIGLSLYQGIDLGRGTALLAELADQIVETLLLGRVQADLERRKSQTRSLQHQRGGFYELNQ